jgi:hypothetical protein
MGSNLELDHALGLPGRVGREGHGEFNGEAPDLTGPVA